MAILCLIVTCEFAHAEKRVALVIGNSHYSEVPTLPNPSNDAAAIAQSLSRLGFDVTLRQDLRKETMERELADFSDKVTSADFALVYYAGHGIEMNGQNYLIPVDARLSSDNRIQFETVSLEDVMAAIEGAKTLKLVLLDACRDNPFANTMKRSIALRSIGRGLAKVETNPGVLVSYAAAAGTTAADGEGNHSPYTAALLSHLEEPGLELSLLFRKVADEVMKITDGRQTPFEYGRLPGLSLYMRQPEQLQQVASVTPIVTETTPVVIATDPCRDAAAHWNAIQAETDPALFNDHLERFGACAFATLARARLTALKNASTAAVAIQPEVTETAAVDNNPVVPVETSAQAGDETVEKSRARDAARMLLLARDLQVELRRVGCLPSPADGIWGRQSQKALDRFSAAAGQALDSQEPTGIALNAVQQERQTVCVPQCGRRERLEDGQCVARTCGFGQVLSRKGICIEAERPTPSFKRRHREREFETVDSEPNFRFRERRHHRRHFEDRWERREGRRDCRFCGRGQRF